MRSFMRGMMMILSRGVVIGISRPLSRVVTGCHGHHNDRHGSDRRGVSDNHRGSNNNYSGSNNRLNFKSIQLSSTHEHDPNITA
uniref:Secreted protein n=1 Tax=Tanacetum cinerariifolium TaxID=118510 RepID=A0A699W6G6_TANCI|nr:hypothetical protein [Tanacetum cinerariifolium]